MSDRAHISVSLPNEVFDWVYTQATRRSLTVSGFVRQLIMEARDGLQRRPAPRCERSGEAGEAHGDAAP